jgi:hypothetical protein
MGVKSQVAVMGRRRGKGRRDGKGLLVAFVFSLFASVDDEGVSERWSSVGQSILKTCEIAFCFCSNTPAKANSRQANFLMLWLSLLASELETVC